jgi:hypothetical protein
MKIIFTVLIIFLSCCPALCSARGADAAISMRLFAQANAAYEKGDYDAAIKGYDEAVSSGLKGGGVYYNLGNVGFKNGDLGLAVLNYERARLIMPLDSDLLANYRYVKSLLKQQDPPEKRMIILKWLDLPMRYLTVGQGVFIAAALYFFLMFYVILTRVFRKYAGFSMLVICLILPVLAAVTVPLIHKIGDIETSAIVTSKIVDARFEPQAGALVHFPMYEGMKVNIVRKKNQWYKIRRPDGKLGWVERPSVTPIL